MATFPVVKHSVLCKYNTHNIYIYIYNSTTIILIQMYNIFRLLIGVPDYSSSESYREKQKLIGFIVIISQRGVCKS